MLIIPAIDLKNGKCVRLLHGKAEDETIYSDNPLAMAEKWVAAGAKRLHVIDLDGAFQGKPQNLEWVVKIKKNTNVEIQMGGGLRSMEAIRGILKAGIDKVILGTIVVEEAGIVREAFEEFRGQIMVALDVKNGNVATRGWKDDSGFPIQDALQIVEKLGGREVIFTDIGRDGTMTGVNLIAVQAMMAMTKLKIYASGGVSSLDDVKQLKSINSPGCIVGKAIYEGKLDLTEAIKIASN